MEIKNEEHCLIRYNRYVNIFAAAIDVENVFLRENGLGKNLFYFIQCDASIVTAKACHKSYILGHSFYIDKEGILIFLYSNINDDFNLLIVHFNLFHILKQKCDIVLHFNAKLI